MTDASSQETGAFIQPKITGYRQLTDADAALINDIKAHGIALEFLLGRLAAAPGIDRRWVAIGKTDLQTGLMALVRAVAQPTTF
jgi:hypothetical protein